MAKVKFWYLVKNEVLIGPVLLTITYGSFSYIDFFVLRAVQSKKKILHKTMLQLIGKYDCRQPVFLYNIKKRKDNT